MEVPRTRRARAAVVSVLSLLTLAATGCARDAPQDALKPAGPLAREADRLWDVTFAIAVVVFFLVEGILVLAIWRFRRRDDGRQAEQFHGNPKLEVVLTLIPSLILAGLAVPTVKTIFSVADLPDGNDVLRVDLTGRQFWWEYSYADLGIVTANELHIPEDTEVVLTLKGADVIHSFWVPRLAGGQDVIPGRINYMRLEADEPGKYLGQCKEFCGLSHANMRQVVFAHTEQEFAEWVDREQQQAAEATDPLARRGAEIFVGEGGCTGCHAIDGLEGAERVEGKIGPDLTHFASRRTFAGAIFENNTDNLTRWMRDPPAMKPGVDMPKLPLDEEQIQALVAYLETLK